MKASNSKRKFFANNKNFWNIDEILEIRRFAIKFCYFLHKYQKNIPWLNNLVSILAIINENTFISNINGELKVLL